MKSSLEYLMFLCKIGDPTIEYVKQILDECDSAMNSLDDL
jgi:hypothetical protein